MNKCAVVLGCLVVNVMGWGQVSVPEERAGTEAVLTETREAFPTDLQFRGAMGPSFAEEVVMLVNQERLNNGGLPPLKHNALLDDSSLLHSTNMGARDFFAHCDLDTMTDPGDRMTTEGYFWNWAAENIAAGQADPQSVMTGWMASTGHRNNILSTNYREIGVGYFFNSGDSGNIRRDLNDDCLADSFNNGPFFRYWTQNFGRRNNVFPVIINREAYSTDDEMVQLYLYGAGSVTEMRIRNAGGAWTSWQAFQSEVPWTLDALNGVRQVDVELRNGPTVYSASDTILLMLVCQADEALFNRYPDWDLDLVNMQELVAINDGLCSNLN